MLKTIIVTLNIIGLIVFNILLEDVKVTQKVPDRVESEGDFVVEVTIEKAGVTGFAKYQCNLPLGVVAEPVETQGATFTFAQQKVKFIWMSLPDKEEFTIKFKVKITDPYLASIPIAGTFSYLDENKRMTVDAPPKEVQVGEDVVVEEVVPEPVVSAERTITPLGDNKYKVEIVIDKENVDGFAKVQDMVPSGAVITPEETTGSVFSNVDKKVKFVWMDIPTSKELKVSYIMDLSDAESKNPNDVRGEFAYLFKGEAQSVVIGGEQPVETEGVAVVTEQTVVKETVEKEDGVLAEVVETETVSEVKEVEKKEVTPVPEPKTSVEYRVQIMAAHRSVGKPYFENVYNYSGPFVTENHEGWVKYTTGSFDVYKAARNQRENVKSYNFPGPFVVAYNSGKRITVQEALMITNQKWIK